jgi:hypothetical protein
VGCWREEREVRCRSGVRSRRVEMGSKAQERGKARGSGRWRWSEVEWGGKGRGERGGGGERGRSGEEAAERKQRRVAAAGEILGAGAARGSCNMPAAPAGPA